MSEYWKSTPSYWCKFCTTYVRDTPLAKQQHDASGRHQGNIARSLRTLHTQQERAARDTARAQDEVRRLNGLVARQNPATASQDRSSTAAAAPAAPARAATLDDRKRQMAQLVALGATVPEEFRAELAQAGEWKTVAPPRRTEMSPAAAGARVKVEPGAESFGVRKRAADEDGDEEEDGGSGAAVHVPGRAWGSRTKVARKEEDVDIAALVGRADESRVKRDPGAVAEDGTKVKSEDGEEDKTGVGDAEPAVVFKKRRKNRA